MHEDVHFFVFSVFDDATTFHLFHAVAKVLDLPFDTVLKEFGTYFLTYCLKHGYDKMLLTLGQDLFTFVENLDSLHSMLSLSYRGILSPSFRCLEHENGMLTLHHYSWREGMYPVVQGLVEAVGKELFNQVATVTLIETSKEEVDIGKFLYHSTMQVELLSCPQGEALITTRHELTKAKVARRRHTLHSPRKPQGGTETIARAEDLCMAFPYHIVMDEDLHILQCGDNIRRLIPFAISNRTRFPDIAAIRQPVISPTVEHIVSFINSIFFIDIHPQHEQPFGLKGQMMYLPGSGTLMFVGSPRLQSLDQFKEMKVYLVDLPLYDCTRELVLLNQQRFAEIDVARQLDETTIALKKTSKDLEEEKHKTEGLLHEMMPRKVARQLQEFGYVRAEKHEWSTVLFTSIITFKDIANSCTADQVVNMLNDMYQRFDTHIDAHEVHKVETIGDAYMAVTGVPEVQEDHAERMANFAMEIVEEAGQVKSPATGLPLQIRVGMNSGAVVSGVIGKKKPRYDIYGDTVNTASRMTSHSVPGRIHVSFTAFEKLFFKGYVFKSRGEIEVKGKGRMNTYFLTGTMIRDLEQPDDEFTSLPDVFDPEFKVDSKTKLTERTRKAKTSSDADILRERLMSMHGSASSTASRSALVRSSAQFLGLPSISSHSSSLSRMEQAMNKGPTALSTDSLHLSGRRFTQFAKSTFLASQSANRRSTRFGILPEHHTQTWNLSPPPPSAASVRAAEF